MKLSVSDQYFQFLKSIDVDLDQLPESLRYQEDYQKEEFALSTLDYFHLLTALDELLTDEQILEMSCLKNIQMMMPPFLPLCRQKTARWLSSILQHLNASQDQSLWILKPLMIWCE